MIRNKNRCSERGSAYIVVLLVLLLLTIFGLSLVLITQTERQIGAATRDISRTFYASDSGTAAAVSYMLTTNNYEAHAFRISEKQVGSAGVTVVDEVATSRVRPVGSRYSNLGDIASNAVFPPYERINHQFRSTATRSRGSRELAQKRLELMIEVDPWQPTAEALYDGPLDYESP